MSKGSGSRRDTHTSYELKVHVVFSTNYFYEGLGGQVEFRCRDLIRQDYDALDIQIIKGVVRKDRVHVLMSYPPKVSIIDRIQWVMGRTSKKLPKEFPNLKKRYVGCCFCQWDSAHRVQQF